jgi:hypothetical protein
MSFEISSVESRNSTELPAPERTETSPQEKLLNRYIVLGTYRNELERKRKNIRRQRAVVQRMVGVSDIDAPQKMALALERLQAQDRDITQLLEGSSPEEAGNRGISAELEQLQQEVFVAESATEALSKEEDILRKKLAARFGNSEKSRMYFHTPEHSEDVLQEHQRVLQAALRHQAMSILRQDLPSDRLREVEALGLSDAEINQRIPQLMQEPDEKIAEQPADVTLRDQVQWVLQTNRVVALAHDVVQDYSVFGKLRVRHRGWDAASAEEQKDREFLLGQGAFYNKGNELASADELADDLAAFRTSAGERLIPDEVIERQKGKIKRTLPRFAYTERVDENGARVADLDVWQPYANDIEEPNLAGDLLALSDLPYVGRVDFAEYQRRANAEFLEINLDFQEVLKKGVQSLPEPSRTEFLKNIGAAGIRWWQASVQFIRHQQERFQQTMVWVEQNLGPQAAQEIAEPYRYFEQNAQQAQAKYDRMVAAFGNPHTDKLAIGQTLTDPQQFEQWLEEMSHT